VEGERKTGTARGEYKPRKEPARQARDRARRKREEKRWARKSGSVTSRFVCPICGAPHLRADHTEP
jgi:hypothetical protein